MTEAEIQALARETARAQIYAHDDEADRLITKNGFNERDASRVPPRGAAPGEARLQAAQKLLPGVIERREIEERKSARQVERREEERVSRLQGEAAQTLGVSVSEMLRVDNWSDWIDAIRQGRAQAGGFMLELAKVKGENLAPPPRGPLF
jgi:hypothetical protein